MCFVSELSTPFFLKPDRAIDDIILLDDNAARNKYLQLCMELSTHVIAISRAVTVRDSKLLKITS